MVKNTGSPVHLIKIAGINFQIGGIIFAGMHTAGASPHARCCLEELSIKESSGETLRDLWGKSWRDCVSFFFFLGFQKRTERRTQRIQHALLWEKHTVGWSGFVGGALLYLFRVGLLPLKADGGQVNSSGGPLKVYRCLKAFHTLVKSHIMASLEPASTEARRRRASISNSQIVLIISWCQLDTVGKVLLGQRCPVAEVCYLFGCEDGSMNWKSTAHVPSCIWWCWMLFSS